MSVSAHDAAVAGMFGRIAGVYDVGNRILSCGIDIYWRRVLADTVRLFADSGLYPVDVCPSPITGAKGNREFFLLGDRAPARRASECPLDEHIEVLDELAAAAEAQQALDLERERGVPFFGGKFGRGARRLGLVIHTGIPPVFTIPHFALPFHALGFHRFAIFVPAKQNPPPGGRMTGPAAGRPVFFTF